MALVTMKTLLERAKAENKGVGAFSVGNMEMIKGAIQAAEESSTSIILQIAEVRLQHSPLSLMGAMMVQGAKDAKVDIAVHLDHGMTVEVMEKALELGFTSVMFDGSKYSLEENIAKTKEVVALAKQYGATVEAELGVVGGSEDGSEDHKMQCTNPQDAKRFCEETGVDALAVAIGNAHGAYAKTPNLEFAILEEIHRVTAVPLVLHGGSGITDDDFQKCISLGIVKVNIATASFNAMTKKVEEYLQKEGAHNYFAMNEAMVAGSYECIKHHMGVFSMRG